MTRSPKDCARRITSRNVGAKRSGEGSCTTTSDIDARLVSCGLLTDASLWPILPASDPDPPTYPMLSFRTTPSGPIGDVRSAERWLATLPANDPLVAQRSIVAELRKLAARTTRRKPPMLEGVFAVDAHANGLVRTLTAQYIEHAKRSSKIEDQLWQGLFELAQGFQECYAAFAREIADQLPRSKWHTLLPALIGRQIVHLRQDAKLRLYHCERWTPAKWSELFGPFTRACANRVEREPLRLDPMAGPTTIEREFLMTLLLQLADPGNLVPKEIEWIAAQLDAWCQPLRLTLTPKSAATFYIDLAGSTGLRRRSLAPLEGRVLFLDLQPLHALLLQNRAALEQAVKNEPRSGKTSQYRQQLGLFVKLASRLDPEFKPLARRGERKPAAGAVDAIVGFPSIAAFLRTDKTGTFTAADAGRSFGNTMELAVFGRMRAEPAARPKPGLGRLAAHTAPGGPWEMKDISASGFRLHAPMSVAMELTLNMLVAIRRQDQEPWVMGVVRRMRRLSSREAEIGLQLIANALVSAELFEQRKERADDYSVAGEPAPGNGRQFHGLFLSFNRREGEPTVQSLIVPAVEYHPSRLYTLRIGTSTRTIRHGRLLEQHADWTWTVIDTVSPGTDATGSGSAG
jgi:hypothetical protein